jgi:hypothetical protein
MREKSRCAQLACWIMTKTGKHWCICCSCAWLKHYQIRLIRSNYNAGTIQIWFADVIAISVAAIVTMTIAIRIVIVIIIITRVVMIIIVGFLSIIHTSSVIPVAIGVFVWQWNCSSSQWIGGYNIQGYSWWTSIIGIFVYYGNSIRISSNRFWSWIDKYSSDLIKIQLCQFMIEFWFFLNVIFQKLNTSHLTFKS